MACANKLFVGSIIFQSLVIERMPSNESVVMKEVFSVKRMNWVMGIFYVKRMLGYS